VQVDALVRSACRAPSREAGEVQALPFLPFRRLEVSAILGPVPGHGARSLLSPQEALSTLSSDGNQRALMKDRKL
jgi:hypothetical protein